MYLQTCALIDERLCGWLPPLVSQNELMGVVKADMALQFGLDADVGVAPGGQYVGPVGFKI